MSDVEWWTKAQPSNGSRCVVLATFAGKKVIAVTYQHCGEWPDGLTVKAWCFASEFDFMSLPKRVLAELANAGPYGSDAVYAWRKCIVEQAQMRERREDREYRPGGRQGQRGQFI